MFSRGTEKRFSELLYDQGAVIYLPEEVVEAYRQGVFALTLWDVDIAPQDDRVPEERLFEAVAENSRFRKRGLGIIDSPPPRESFLPTLRSDFSYKQWKSVREGFELTNGEVQLVSLPDFAAAEVATFDLKLESRWKPFGQLCVLNAGKSKVVSTAKIPKDFDLNPNEAYFGAVVVCRRFYASEPLQALAAEIQAALKHRMLASTIVEIADSLELT